MKNRLREALENNEFVVTCEVIPGRGAAEPSQQHEFEAGCEIWETGKVNAISITDNPSGNPALLADAFASDFTGRGITSLVHFTCKDRSRNQMQSQLYAMQRQGIENLLVMTGDYQCSGWMGRSRPVFDLDPVQVLSLVNDMNAGLSQKTAKGEKREAAADFFAGVVVNPFKYTEAETLTQYWKLEKKIAAGAKFVVTQVGYDSRKMRELKMYLDKRGYTTPLIANIFLLTKGAAKLMRKGTIAGCYVSDLLLQTLEQESEADDKGLAARFARAAKMIAIAKGLGFAGVHIGGFGITAEAFNNILAMSNEFLKDWQQHAGELEFGAPGGFYYYDRAGAENGRNEIIRNRKLMSGYGLSRFFHHLVLTRDKGFYGILRALMERKERRLGMHRRHGLEHLGKTILYGCIDCGDCGLETTIYTCPMSQCPKCQRNGPCGGSNSGWCEVYPDKRYCIYFKAYHRLKKYNELEKLDSYITVPNDWSFLETSGWSNYTHERDNASKRISMPPHGERSQR
jgi:methylenetetrahydrofolate reductase (NADPH)